MSRRFSKAEALRVLDERAKNIAAEHQLDRGNGTSQLSPKDRMSDADVNRAVAYGMMRAYEKFAESIEEGFAFDQPEGSGK